MTAGETGMPSVSTHQMCGAWRRGLVVGVAGLESCMVGLNDLKGLPQPK